MLLAILLIYFQAGTTDYQILCTLHFDGLVTGNNLPVRTSRRVCTPPAWSTAVCKVGFAGCPSATRIATQAASVFNGLDTRHAPFNSSTCVVSRQIFMVDYGFSQNPINSKSNLILCFRFDLKHKIGFKRDFTSPG